MSYLIMQDGKTHEITEELPPIDCFRCGVCCVRLRPKVGEEEITTIASQLGISYEAFIQGYTRVLPKSEKRVLDNGGNQCPFLKWERESGSAECTIHPFRPQACCNWQASLSRAECQEGLRKLKPEKGILLPHDMYSSQQEINGLNSTLAADSESQEVK